MIFYVYVDIIIYTYISFIKSSHILIIFIISFQLLKYHEITNTLPSFTIFGMCA